MIWHYLFVSIFSSLTWHIIFTHYLSSHILSFHISSSIVSPFSASSSVLLLSHFLSCLYLGGGGGGSATQIYKSSTHIVPSSSSSSITSPAITQVRTGFILCTRCTAQYYFFIYHTLSVRTAVPYIIYLHQNYALDCEWHWLC